MNLRSSYDFTVSIVIVSFNARNLLWDCLESLVRECNRLPEDLSAEVLVVDNASRDGSAELVLNEFAARAVPVRLFRSEINLGLAAANNLAMESALGKYLVLLSTHTFFQPGALRRAIGHMDANSDAGVGGAQQISPDGEWLSSARSFPSIWGDALGLAGLSARFPHSPDRAWASPDGPADVDWVPGAFAILRREALNKSGLFDPAFFRYFEEVDLCRRIKSAGFRVVYWPDVVVTHIGCESARQTLASLFSERGTEIVLWRLRSTFIYYRKHHGWQALLARWLESSFYSLRALRNRLSHDLARRERAKEFTRMVDLVRQAWSETSGGRVSPPRPW